MLTNRIIMIKISVIIPIYKTENFIERCVRSLMEQTMKKDIEFIFINDCTPDNSMKILYTTILEYPHRKEQITILNNETNLGASDSRKRAINIAKGIYIGCCDSDDWIDKNMYETLYNASNNGETDIVVCKYILETADTQSIREIKPSSTPQESLAHLDNPCMFSYSMCNQIIKKKILKQQISKIIPTQIREDTFLMMRVYHQANTIKFIPNAFYHYRRDNQESLTHNKIKTLEEFEIQKQNFESICSLLYSNNGYKKYHLACNKFKYMLKLEYKTAFKDLKSFYYAFKESHADIDYIFKEECYSLTKRLKYKFVYNTNYFIYKMYFALKNV